jgi:hypothetical protein
MTAPVWLAGTLAGVMIATAAYCLGRIAAARRWQRWTSYDVDGIHVLMGVAMAGMLAPRLNPLTGSGWARNGWEVLFGAAAFWFAWQAVRGRHHRAAAATSATAHHLQHLLACGAMVYMFLAVVPATAGNDTAGNGAASMAMGGPAGRGLPGPGSGVPALALVLALGLLGYVIWTTDRLMSLARAAGRQAAVAQTQPGSSDPRPALAGLAPGDQVAAGAARPRRVPAAAMAPMSARLSACCDIVMGLTMGYMLITML